MENQEIKTEDISDNVLLYIKEEETENEIVNIDDVKGEELLEIKKEEECEDEGVDSQFETIFLPEIYDGVVVETPFFDFNSYKKRYGLPTEDDEINRSQMNVHFNRENLENNIYENIEVDYDRQIKNLDSTENGVLESESEYDDGTVPHSIDQQNCNKISSDSAEHVNENVFHSENGFVQAYIEACVKAKTKTYTRGKFVNDNRLQEDCQIIDLPQHIRGGEYTSQNENKHLQMNLQEPTVSSCIKTPPANSINESKRHKAKNDDGKYKCPLCKRLRVFDTLLAINNHLKFEHISIFSNRGGKLIEKIIPQSKSVKLTEKTLRVDNF